MQPYVPPIDDYRFLMSEVLDFEGAMNALEVDVDVDFAITILKEAGKLCTQVLHPLNCAGDEQGAQLIKGEVKTADGFADAYQQFAQAGWTSLSASPEYGGQKMPYVLQLWLDEMVAAANLSFSLFPSLSRGAIEAIEAHGSKKLKSAYLPRMVAGEWTGVMALTESQAGSDLAQIRTRAVPLEDDTYVISGQKIFISSGDHDFGGNIVHLVLARLPDAPAGVRGISLFLVPKFLPGLDNAYTQRNSMSVGALEHKMGLHAQPTCVMNYDEATGWLIGEPHHGLKAMFTMMNSERLAVGIQGLGVGSAAYQQSAAYAKERLQGRSADGSRSPVPIIEHADVRRMLLTMRCYTEAGRALAGWTALQFDRAREHPDASERAKADKLVALLTPVVKAALTDFGFESAVLAQQVLGGHGYIREWGVEQFVRDARIPMIYEGTNGIQAMDLVGRKLFMDDGAVVESFLAQIVQDAESGASGQVAVIAAAMSEAVDVLRAATVFMRTADSYTQGGICVDYLRMFTLVSYGWMWLLMAKSAERGATPFHATKLKLATYFAQRLLPQIRGLSAGVSAGSAVIASLIAAEF